MNVEEKTSELAPHGLRYDPPKWEEVMDLASRAAVEGVERSKTMGETSKLLIALRHLLEHSYRPVFALLRTPRDKRSVEQQDEVFRLNHYYQCVKRLLEEGEEAWRDFNHDGWDLNLWISRRRQQAQWLEAKAALTPAMDGIRGQVQSLLRERQEHGDSGSDQRRRKSQRKEPGNGSSEGKTTDVGRQRAKGGRPNGNSVIDDSNRYYMPYEERVKCRETKARKGGSGQRKPIAGSAKTTRSSKRVDAK